MSAPGNAPIPLAKPLWDADRAIAPAPDVIEISLLGPGYGECAVLHLGDGQWAIVDSCLSDDRKTPAALEYLQQIGVDAATAVSHFVITHADNDHIGGAAALFAACSSAELVHSAALTHREMMAWVAFSSDSDRDILARASTELAAILESMPKRGQHPISALQDRALVDRAGCKLTALSPNDGRIAQFLATIAQQLPKAGAPRRRIPELTPNQASVALILETPACTVILGADLEEAGGGAWTHIIQNSTAYRNAAPAVLIKVPHHGSPNADCPAVWQNLAQPAIAILATFSSGVTPRPSQTDVDRILSHTNHAFSCSTFNKPKPARDAEIDKFMKMMNIDRTRRYSNTGHVRVRFVLGREPTLELFGEAAHLSRVHAA